MRCTAKKLPTAVFVTCVSSGKSHTECSISLGKGQLYVASKGQKIVTKASTEAELVALSDMASQTIHDRGFVLAQGHTVGPVVIYQDNISR